MREELIRSSAYILVIIDGLDELNGWEDLNADNVPEVNDDHSPQKIPVLFHNVVAGNLLQSASFLFTSRPMDSLKTEDFRKTIRIFGFGRESIEDCILAICKNNKDTKKQVLDYLDRRPHLYYFCNVPISCIMTGKVVYDELSSGAENGLDSETLSCATDLYISVLLIILNSRPLTDTNQPDNGPPPRKYDRFGIIHERGSILQKVMNQILRILNTILLCIQSKYMFRI